jgi:hypothetical protein
MRGDVLHVGPQHVRQPNYVPLVDALIDRERHRLKPGTLHHVLIAHDDGCAIEKGRACNCNPSVQLQELDPS